MARPSIKSVYKRIENKMKIIKKYKKIIGDE